MRGATPRKTLAVCIYNISIHAPYARSDLISMSVPPSTSFQSTLLMRGATSSCVSTTRRQIEFQSTLLMRGATCPIQWSIWTTTKFQSTLLMRGATRTDSQEQVGTIFQSTLLMRGATKEAWRDLLSIMISIHAPHARSDRALSEHRGLHHQISIHAPHARSDSSSTSTPTACTNFNPRSSCEERRADSSGLRKELGISIHAPHARSDGSRGGRHRGHDISIHAPHARSDNSKQAHVRFIDKISIHAPHARSD